jgi:hypothetical protein
MIAKRDSYLIGLIKKIVPPFIIPLLKKFWRRRRRTINLPHISAIDRLQPSEVPAKVSVRQDETILLNESPFFPIGLYYAHDEISDTTGAELGKLRSMGFNIIFFEGGLDSEHELDRIWGAGLHVWFRPPGQLYREFELLKQVVSKFARHPAVLFWEMDDEPILNRLKFSDVEVGCRIVRSIDPYHPILCNQWLSSPDQAEEMRRWAEIADLYGFGVYPVPLWRWKERLSLVEKGWPHSIAVVGKQTDLWRSYAPSKPVIPVLQAWAWNCLEDGVAAYPTYRECRFMAYHAVIHGAKGLHHYGAVGPRRPLFECGIPPKMYEDLDQTHADFLRAQQYNHWFWSYYSKVIKELSRMSSIFTSYDAGWTPGIRETPSNQGKATRIECRVKRHQDSDIILLVNSSDSQVAVEVDAPEISDRLLILWGLNRSVPVNSDGLFHDVLEPYGVRIYSDQPDLIADSQN